jgi:CRISPR-associated protein Csy3
LAKRYAINLANGRYLWRNRVGAEKVEVVITAGSDTWTFNAHDFSLKNFDSSNANVLALAQKIADALSGKIPYLLLNVEAYALVGTAQEVYPSEELVLIKAKAIKAKFYMMLMMSRQCTHKKLAMLCALLILGILNTQRRAFLLPLSRMVR